MANPRFFLDPSQWSDTAQLQGDEAHHALDVLRLKTGDRIAVFDGLGTEAVALITGESKSSVSLRLGTRSSTGALPCEITLAQAIPKGKNMDLIIQKAVELGARRIVPLLSERTVIHLEPGENARKREKWLSVAIGACKQCGQNWLPEIADPQSPAAFFSGPSAPSELSLVASLQPDARHIKTVLASAATDLGHPPRSVTVLVGPEGDFTPAEIALAKSSGCRPITLGPIILRSETAAIYCLSVLSHELFV